VSRAVTRKRKRLYIALLGLLSLGTGTALVLTAFEDNLVFFYSPTDIVQKGLVPEQYVRIGGLVEEGSVRQLGDSQVQFVVTDLTNAVPVTYTGILPDLFREGQGVVAQGSIGDDGQTFVAREVLARHDENYMPTEVAEALQASGQWKPESGQPPPR
jgi:cytochrome c-type biogenesis protein CcmE